MNAKSTLGTLLFLLSCLFVANSVAQADDEEVISRSVRARVIRSVGEGLNLYAKRIPGKFTVPKGYVAVDFKYHFHDPNDDVTRTKLGSGNIYSTTQGEYIPAAGDGSTLTLPSGEYKFVVGGKPGAYGSLGFKLVPLNNETDNNSDDESTGTADRTIEVVTWLDNFPESKTKAIYHVTGKKVTGSIDQVYDIGNEGNPNVSCDPYRNIGKFTGTISGNVITGTWKIETQPHRWKFTNSNGESYSRVDSGGMTVESRLILKSGGKVSETVNGSGTLHWQWSADAPAAIKPRTQTHKHEINIPDKNNPGGFVGTWKDR